MPLWIDRRNSLVETSVTLRASGLVYRNPKPHLRSIVAYHPSLVLMGGSELLATFDLGQAVESLDYHTVAALSTDHGETWRLLGPLIPDGPPRTTHTVRTSRLADGSLVGLGGLFHRQDPEQGLLNPETFGYVPVDLFLLRSFDGGRLWTVPKKIEPPLVGPSWEVCHPIVELRDGRWLAPLSTWRAWNGENPSGDQAVVLISDDRGESWPTYGRTFDGRETGRCHLEQSIVELRDGRILATSWVHDPKAAKNFPTEYSVSEDGGASFSSPAITGFHAQTCKATELRDGRLVCAYRRNDRAGLWVTVARLDGNRWSNIAEAPLWLGAESGMTGQAPSARELSALKFGYPQLKQLANGEVLLLFWCQENCVTNIRWIRFAVE